MTTLWRDLAYALRMIRKAPAFAAIAIVTLALRMLRKTPGFTLIAVLTLALGICLLPLCTALGWAQKRVPTLAQQKAPIRVLLIGNSFIYFHNMPALLEAISKSLPGPRLMTEMIASGGATLKDHWEEESTRAAIRKGGWDYVVLDEQSSLAGLLIVNQQNQIPDPAHFWKYAALFDGEIRKAGARTVILMTWKDKAAPLRSQQALDYSFVTFAKSHDAIVVPVSLAWQRIRQSEPSVNLYANDDHHPSVEGSYLIACVFYATLARLSPVGAVSAVKGTPIDEDEGQVLTGKTETLAALGPEVARKLQQVAWSTYLDISPAGYPLAPAPAPVSLPALPAGHRPQISEVEGVWRGPLHFYPNNLPIEMELRISNPSSGLSASLHVFYHGTKPDTDIALSDFHLTDSGVAFTDLDGPNKGTIEFSGAFSPEEIHGIAKTMIPPADPSITVWGTWDLKRLPKS